MNKENVKRLMFFLLLAIVGLGLWGCGGGGSSSYTDLNAEYTQADLRLTEAGDVNSLIAPETLRDWDANAGSLDDGLYATDEGKRVIVVSVTSDEHYLDNYLNGHIPGALLYYSHLDGETMERNDGPFVEPHDVADGAAMDSTLQMLGIEKDDVVVLSTTKTKYSFCRTRMFWTMRYWGFSRANLKVLDGSIAGWKEIGGKLATNPPVKPQPSTMSVTDLPSRNFNLRVGIGEMIDLVDSGRAGEDFIIFDAREPLQSFVYAPNFTLGSKPGAAFDGIIKGSLQIQKVSPINADDLYQPHPEAGKMPRDYKFKSAETLRTAFAEAGIDGSKPIIAYCNSGASVARYWYVLAEILGYDTAIFDAGMWSWLAMSAYEPGDLTYVRHDYSTGALTDTYDKVSKSYLEKNTDPTYGFLQSRFFTWDGTQFVDSETGLPIPEGSVVPGGNLNGDDTWDTVKRSEMVSFRPTHTVNNPATFQTFYQEGDVYEGTVNSVHSFDQAWRPVTAYPYYDGMGSDVEDEDASYSGGGSIDDGSAPPTPTTTGGGGC